MSISPKHTPYLRINTDLTTRLRVTPSKNDVRRKSPNISTRICVLKNANLQTARRTRPGVLVLRVPSTGGDAICRAIRTDAILWRTPVLLVYTPDTEAVEITAALQAGANDCLSVPCEMEEFVAKLGQLLERRAVPANIARAHREVQTLSARLESVREEERIRMSREVHDELGQLLTSLKMDVAWVHQHLNHCQSQEVQQVAHRLAAMSGLIDETVNCVRRIAADLRPSMLDDIGLLAALEWQAGEWQARSGVTCRLVSAPAVVCLNDEQTTAVFRIFKEMLTNIARHAGATQVEIRLAQTKEAFSLSVHDNGCGCTPDKLYTDTSLGLLGMRERAALLGGTVSLHSQPDAGTTVAVTLPL